MGWNEVLAKGKSSLPRTHYTVVDSDTLIHTPR